MHMEERVESGSAGEEACVDGGTRKGRWAGATEAFRALLDAILLFGGELERAWVVQESVIGHWGQRTVFRRCGQCIWSDVDANDLENRLWPSVNGWLDSSMCWAWERACEWALCSATVRDGSGTKGLMYVRWSDSVFLALFVVFFETDTLLVASATPASSIISSALYFIPASLLFPRLFDFVSGPSSTWPVGASPTLLARVCERVLGGGLSSLFSLIRGGISSQYKQPGTRGQKGSRTMYYNKYKCTENGCGRAEGYEARAVAPINTSRIPTSWLCSQYSGSKSDNTWMRHGIVIKSLLDIIWAEMWPIFGENLAYWLHNLQGKFRLKCGAY